METAVKLTPAARKLKNEYQKQLRNKKLSKATEYNYRHWNKVAEAQQIKDPLKAI